MKRLILFLTAALMLFVNASASVDSVIYNKDKSITVYGTFNGDSEEFGICVNPDENKGDFSSSVRFKAYGGKNAEGKFGVVIPYSEFAQDGVFALKEYSVSENGSVVYSDNTIIAEPEKEHSRIPALNNAIPSEGELYPPFSKEISEYYVLVDKIPEKPLSIKYEAENKADSVVYEEGTDISESVRINLSSGFKENTYKFSYRLRKKAKLTPEKYFIKLVGASLSVSDGFDFSDNKVNYIIPDISALPEKYIPTKAFCSINGTAGNTLNIAACTEPFIETTDWSNVAVSYLPQTEEYRSVKLNSGDNILSLNEKEFKTRSSIKLALKGTNGTSISDFAFEIEYFEDNPLPVTGEIKGAELASLSVEGANEIYPEFQSDVYEYYAVFDTLPENSPKIICVPGNPGAKVKVYPASDISGETSVMVTLGDITNTYKVKFREYKEAAMKLTSLSAKRTPYVLFNMSIPRSDTTPYHTYVGRIENEYGTSHSHLTAMGFDTTKIKESNIHISTAELSLYATTNCKEGIYVDLYRCTNTSWTSGAAGRNFFMTANHFVPRGAEGKLNEDTLIKYTDGKTEPKHFRYYTIPLNTVGFTNAKSINLYYLTRWQSVNPPNATYQNTYVWMGRSGKETYNGMGMLPTVYVKYFVK